MLKQICKIAILLLMILSVASTLGLTVSAADYPVGLFFKDKSAFDDEEVGNEEMICEDEEIESDEQEIESTEQDPAEMEPYDDSSEGVVIDDDLYREEETTYSEEETTYMEEEPEEIEQEEQESPFYEEDAISEEEILDDGEKELTEEIILQSQENAKMQNTILLSKAKIRLSVTKCTYTGNYRMPSVNAVYGSVRLKKNTDYTVKYQNNKNIGTATVTITGKGKYSGTVTKTFKIVPQKVSVVSVKEKSNSIIVAWEKPDVKTTGYQVQYSSKRNFATHTQKTIKKNTANKTIIEDLKAEKKYFIRVRTYKTVDGKNYCSAWSAIQKATTLPAFEGKGNTSKYYCTRAQYLKLLWLMSGFPVSRSESYYSDTDRSDDYFDAVQFGYEQSLMGGVNGDFGPNKTVTRKQAALILWKYAGKPYQKVSNSKFSDVSTSTMTTNAVKAVLWCEKNGLINGVNGMFRPDGTLTTKQAVGILYKFAEMYPDSNNKKIFHSNETAVMIGDSFGTGTGGEYQKGWQYYYQVFSGVNGYIYNAGGAGYTRKGDSPKGTHIGHNFPELLDIAYNDVENPNAITQVIIGGGLNDWVSVRDGNEDELRLAIRETILQAKKRFRNAKIYIFPFFGDSKFTGPYIIKSGSHSGKEYSENQRQYSFRALQIIYEEAISISGVYSSLDFVHIMQGGYRFNQVGKFGFGDGKHLNNAGYSFLGNMLAFYTVQ